jgi:hypothetical protein
MPTHEDIERLGAIRAHANRWVSPQTDAEVAKGIDDCKFLIDMIDEYRKIALEAVVDETFDEYEKLKRYCESTHELPYLGKEPKPDPKGLRHLCYHDGWKAALKSVENTYQNGFKSALEEVIESCGDECEDYKCSLSTNERKMVKWTLGRVIDRCKRAIDRESK